jgi:hypothetical protein
MEPLRQALGRGADTGAFRWVEPDRDAPLIYALTGGEMTAALADQPGEDVDGVVAATTGFVLRALGVPPGEPPVR